MKPRRFGFLERAAETFDLPADAVAGVPKLELVGDTELRVEITRASYPTARRRSTSAAEPV